MVWQSARATVARHARERRVVSYGMSPRCRGVLAGTLVVAVVGPVPAHAQAPLTAADSPIPAPHPAPGLRPSQPLKRLRLAPSLLRRVSLLAAGHDREVVLSRRGKAVGDSAVVEHFVMP